MHKLKSANFCIVSRLHEEEKTLQVLESAMPKLASHSKRTDSASQTSPGQGQESPPSAAKAETPEERKTLIETMFGGTLITCIRCLQCHCISEKKEPFTDLSLAFCPPATSQYSSQPERPSEEPKGLYQGSVNGGSETVEPGSAASQTNSIHSVPERNEPSLTVPDMVNYFLAPEILDEDNAYFCEKCSSLQRAEKTMKVVSAPEYLILTLLRFSYNAKCHVRRKILENVTIPPLMRLPVYSRSMNSESLYSASLSQHVDCPESSENLAKKLKPSQKDEQDERKKMEQIDGGDGSVQPVLYVLSSVVVHSGVSSESGHYYSYGRNIDGADGTQHSASRFLFNEDLQNGQAQYNPSNCSALSIPPQQAGSGQDAKDWLLFNDSRVTSSSFQLVQNITNRFPKDTAYVLMYRKQELPEHSTSGETAVNTAKLSSDPPLQKELLDAIIKDNKLYLQVRAHNSTPPQWEEVYDSVIYCAE